jgi:hypothetical protein
MESINLRIDELAAMKEELARLLGSWQDCGGLKPDQGSNYWWASACCRCRSSPP